MHIFQSVSEEGEEPDPEPSPSSDWEGGYFCQHVAMFVLSYFSCMLAILASYNLFIQIYSSVRALMESRRTQSLECCSIPAEGSSPPSVLGVLRRWMVCMLRGVFSQADDGKMSKGARLPLDTAVCEGKLRLKRLQEVGWCKKPRIQYLHLGNGEVLCYLPREVLEHPKAGVDTQSEDIHSDGQPNLADLCKARYKAGHRHVQSARERSVSKRSHSSATFENGPEFKPKVQSPHQHDQASQRHLN